MVVGISVAGYSYFSRNHTVLRCFSFGSEGERIADQRRPIDATELQRFVTLNAITLWAASHLECGGLTPLSNRFPLYVIKSNPTQSKR
jgi:hypothetical protein